MIWTIIPIVGAAAVVGAGLYYGNNHIEVSRYDISSCKIPMAFNGYKIVQLSDLHSKTFGKDNRRLIEVIDKEGPDIVVMTGDMINSFEEEFQVFLDLVEGLKKYKVYFVEGNNETKLSKAKKLGLIKEMKNRGVEILDNEKVRLTKGGSFIGLYGVWCELCYYKEIKSGYRKDTYFQKKNIEKALGYSDRKEFNILLAHNPLYFDTYAKWGADLILSGHIHGGLVRIPGVGGLLSPERRFFPKYSEGQYEIKGSKLIVNRGLGGKPLLPRVFNRPEISVIVLHSEEE
ncbi:MAG: metallophosphoesterase [Clostridium sp.]